MVEGTPVELPCPRPFYKTKCLCGRCVVCGYQMHTSIHGGVIDRPGVIFGHAFIGKERRKRKRSSEYVED